MNARNARFVFLLCVALSLPTLPAWSQWQGPGSFSPVVVIGDNGKPLKLKWTYSVNRNKPVYISQTVEGVSVSLRMKTGDLEVTVNPATLVRTTRVSGSISGSGTGTFSVRATETLRRLEDGTITTSADQVNLNMMLSIQGLDVGVSSRVTAQLIPAVAWFIARNDLDILNPGFVSAVTPSEAHVQGFACIAAQGQRRCSDISQSSRVEPRWEIINQIDTLRVRKHTYSNVVSVRQFDTAGELAAGTDNQPDQLWLAKGVGMIRGSTTIMGRQLDLELKSTSLKLPKISRIRPQDGLGGASLKISGRGFGKAAGQVKLGTGSATVLSWKDTRVQIAAPKEQPPGVYPVKVIRANGIESVPLPVTLP